MLNLKKEMAQTIDQFIASGDFQIGTVDPKSRIAPITQNGRSVLITLAKTPTLTSPFSPWPSYDGGERTNLDLRITPELEKLAEHIDDVIQKTVSKDPSQYYTKVPKMSILYLTVYDDQRIKKGLVICSVRNVVFGRSQPHFGPLTLRPRSS